MIEERDRLAREQMAERQTSDQVADQHQPVPAQGPQQERPEDAKAEGGATVPESQVLEVVKTPEPREAGGGKGEEIRALESEAMKTGDARPLEWRAKRISPGVGRSAVH